MAQAALGAAVSEAGPFANIRTKNLMFRTTAVKIETIYGIRPNAETLRKFEAAKGAVAGSRLPDDKKALFGGYMGLAAANSEATRTSFAIQQAVMTITSYLGKDLNGRELDFEFRLMDAWCSGDITRFMEDEAGKVKSKAAREMAEAARTKSDMMKAFAAAQFVRFYTRNPIRRIGRDRTFRDFTQIMRESPDV